ncbi:hypothetical protein Oter_1244 [Opitutus terrae PB90-1]|uniref:Uncharacterized protein n=1 Tax=Opitutus terrae (strain DSM 11246 / JCM 15787 / PB90-1) TaxID=452637 RepID=B1ZPL0_OPITP|nr:hypothetical protein Oter_1244 [Opitutus terrae PB90-1]
MPVFSAILFRARPEPPGQDLDVNLSAGGGRPGFCESNLGLKKFVFQPGKLVEV